MDTSHSSQLSCFTLSVKKVCGKCGQVLGKTKHRSGSAMWSNQCVPGPAGDFRHWYKAASGEKFSISGLCEKVDGFRLVKINTSVCRLKMPPLFLQPVQNNGGVAERLQVEHS